MKMAPRTTVMLIGFGLICLMQTTPTEAASQHVREVLTAFRRIDFDETKKGFYIAAAKYGVQTQLRSPLVSEALQLPNDTKLNARCLHEMVAKVRDLEGTFYAEFCYMCTTADQYSVECLEAAKPKYLTALAELRTKTLGCLTAK